MVNSGRSGCSLTQRGNLMRPTHVKLEDGAGARGFSAESPKAAELPANGAGVEQQHRLQGTEPTSL